jgi:hypothetical protein
MFTKTKNGVRDGAAWLPCFDLSEAGWTAAQIAELMGVSAGWARKRVAAIRRLSEEAREELRAIHIERRRREAEALAMLGRMDAAKAALAQLDLVEKIQAKREAQMARDRTGDAKGAARPPENKRTRVEREEGEYRDLSTEERRARLRDKLERQAVRFGFGEELEQAFRSGDRSRGH